MRENLKMLTAIGILNAQSTDRAEYQKIRREIVRLETILTKKLKPFTKWGKDETR